MMRSFDQYGELRQFLALAAICFLPAFMAAAADTPSCVVCSSSLCVQGM